MKSILAIALLLISAPFVVADRTAVVAKALAFLESQSPRLQARQGAPSCTTQQCLSFVQVMGTCVGTSATDPLIALRCLCDNKAAAIACYQTCQNDPLYQTEDSINKACQQFVSQSASIESILTQFSSLISAATETAAPTTAAPATTTAAVTSTATAAGISSTVSATATSKPAGAGNNAAGIIGGVVGGVFLIALIVGFLLFRRRRQNSASQSTEPQKLPTIHIEPPEKTDSLPPGPVAPLNYPAPAHSGEGYPASENAYPAPENAYPAPDNGPSSFGTDSFYAKPDGNAHPLFGKPPGN